MSNWDTWSQRRQALIEFQNELQENFGEMDYNIFVFGSYITNRFQENHSDIDLIIYCEDINKRGRLKEFSEKYWTEKGLESDVLSYQFDSHELVFLNGINGGIPLTDYYPKQLKNELFLIWKTCQRDKELLDRKSKYLSWRREIVKRKGEVN